MKIFIIFKEISVCLELLSNVSLRFSQERNEFFTPDVHSSHFFLHLYLFFHLIWTWIYAIQLSYPFFIKNSHFLSLKI